MIVTLTAGLSIDEYLERNFEPGCELLGGETRPKPVGTMTHSIMEKRLTRLLERFYGERRVQFEVSVIIGEEVLIPDVIVFAGDQPATYRGVLDEAPLLVIEILSPSQRAVEMLAKCERYREFGVPFCWVIDPVGRRAWEYNLSQREPAEVRDTFSGPCALRLDEVFAG